MFLPSYWHYSCLNLAYQTPEDAITPRVAAASTRVSAISEAELAGSAPGSAPGLTGPRAAVLAKAFMHQPDWPDPNCNPILHVDL